MIRKGAPLFDSPRHKTILPAFEPVDRKMYRIGGVLLWHEFDASGNHRLNWEDTKVSSWAGYQSVAILRLHQGKFAAITEYQSSEDLPPVFKIVEQ